jgi:hypothetical protein
LKKIHLVEASDAAAPEFNGFRGIASRQNVDLGVWAFVPKMEVSGQRRLDRGRGPSRSRPGPHGTFSLPKEFDLPSSGMRQMPGILSQTGMFRATGLALLM